MVPLTGSYVPDGSSYPNIRIPGSVEVGWGGIQSRDTKAESDIFPFHIDLSDRGDCPSYTYHSIRH